MARRRELVANQTLAGDANDPLGLRHPKASLTVLEEPLRGGQGTRSGDEGRFEENAEADPGRGPGDLHDAGVADSQQAPVTGQEQALGEREGELVFVRGELGPVVADEARIRGDPDEAKAVPGHALGQVTGEPVIGAEPVLEEGTRWARRDRPKQEDSSQQ